MEELAQGLIFVVAAMDGKDSIAKHVCKCPTHDIIHTYITATYNILFMYIQ